MAPGITAFFTRMDAFRFTENRTCLTIEMLDRRIGQRRDATRAPNQARSGWRPHGRRLGQPATPSKDGRNFVQTMGSTSTKGSRRVGARTRVRVKRARRFDLGVSRPRFLCTSRHSKLSHRISEREAKSCTSPRDWPETLVRQRVAGCGSQSGIGGAPRRM